VATIAEGYSRVVACKLRSKRQITCLRARPSLICYTSEFLHPLPYPPYFPALLLAYLAKTQRDEIRGHYRHEIQPIRTREYLQAAIAQSQATETALLQQAIGFPSLINPTAKEPWLRTSESREISQTGREDTSVISPPKAIEQPRQHITTGALSASETGRIPSRLSVFCPAKIHGLVSDFFCITESHNTSSTYKEDGSPSY
jgi:hypothetical protein